MTRIAAILLTFAMPACVRGAAATDGGASGADGFRVVSLAPSLTEIVFALGAGGHLAGVTRYCDFPDAARALPRIGGILDPNLEAIIRLKPALVLAIVNSGNSIAVNRLHTLGVHVLALGDRTLADVFDAIDRIGAALERRNAAQLLAQSLHARIAKVTAETAKLPAVRALVVYDREPIVAAGAGTFADELLHAAHAINVVPRGPLTYPTLSIEAVASLDPDVIIDAHSHYGATETRGFWKRFTSLRAVRRDRIRPIDADLLSRAGPRIVDGLEALAKALR